MEKQTALNWLEERFEKYLAWEEGHHKAEPYTLNQLSKDFEEAKAIEKQQIVEAHYHGQDYTEGDPVYSAAEQYFESTYKTNEQ